MNKKNKKNTMHSVGGYIYILESQMVESLTSEVVIKEGLISDDWHYLLL